MIARVLLCSETTCAILVKRQARHHSGQDAETRLVDFTEKSEKEVLRVTRIGLGKHQCACQERGRGTLSRNEPQIRQVDYSRPKWWIYMSLPPKKFNAGEGHHAHQACAMLANLWLIVRSLSFFNCWMSSKEAARIILSLVCLAQTADLSDTERMLYP